MSEDDPFQYGATKDYIRFNEIEDVLASVDLLAVVAPHVRENPSYWKWMIIGTHGALQGAMVCAFADSTGTSVLEKKSAAKVLNWLNADEATRGEHPKEQLASFADLFRRCLRGSHNCEPLVLTREQCRDIRQLHHEFRNNFAHFTPKGWSIEKAGLPRIIAAALHAVEDLMGRSQLTSRMSEHSLRRLKNSLKVVRDSLEL
jgi:hypothetical protein